MHSVETKGVVLGGKVDGMGGGPPTMESPKEVKKKKLKKIDDHASKVPLTLSDLVGQGKDEGSWTCEVNDTSSNQTNPVEQPNFYEVLVIIKVNY